MKKIINILIISLTVILYASCTPEENDIFPESSANRIAAALKADKDILTSAKNGWLIEYYPVILTSLRRVLIYWPYLPRNGQSYHSW